MSYLIVLVTLLGVMSATAMDTDETKQHLDTIFQEAVNKIQLEGNDPFNSAFNFEAKVEVPNDTIWVTVTDTTFTGMNNWTYGGAYMSESEKNFFSMENDQWQARGKLGLKTNDGTSCETEIRIQPTFFGLRFKTDFKFNSDLKSVIATGMSVNHRPLGGQYLIRCSIPNCRIRQDEACRKLVDQIDEVLDPSGSFIGETRLLEILTSLFQKHLPF